MQSQIVDLRVELSDGLSLSISMCVELTLWSNRPTLSEISFTCLSSSSPAVTRDSRLAIRSGAGGG